MSSPTLLSRRKKFIRRARGFATGCSVHVFQEKSQAQHRQHSKTEKVFDAIRRLTHTAVAMGPLLYDQADHCGPFHDNEAVIKLKQKRKALEEGDWPSLQVPLFAPYSTPEELSNAIYVAYFLRATNYSIKRSKLDPGCPRRHHNSFFHYDAEGEISIASETAIGIDNYQRSSTSTSVSSLSNGINSAHSSQSSATSRSASPSHRYDPPELPDRPRSSVTPGVGGRILGVVFQCQEPDDLLESSSEFICQPPPELFVGSVQPSADEKVPDLLIDKGNTYRNAGGSQQPRDPSRGSNPRPSRGNSRSLNSSTQYTPTAAVQIAAQSPPESFPSSSSTTTNAGTNQGSTKLPRRDKLETFIKDEVLVTDPETAELFYEAVRTKLYYANPDEIERPQGGFEPSLLQLLELQAFGIATCAPSSNSGPSSTTQSIKLIGAPSSSDNQRESDNSSSTNDFSSPNQISTPQTRSEKTSSKSTSQSQRLRRLRCFHNFLAPEIFRSNQETLHKYRTCPGTGWKDFQHLKEHTKNTHSKQVKPLNALQCGQCQDKFPDQGALRTHLHTTDCPIRCRECTTVFDSKFLRLEHEKQEHVEKETEISFLELDKEKWKRIDDDLKSLRRYLALFDKGETSPRVELEEWIKVNSSEYLVGRPNQDTGKTRWELGAWYAMFIAIAPGRDLPEHPFYDDNSLPHGEYAEERIMFILKNMVNSTVAAHGAPGSDFLAQRAWWIEIFQNSIRTAAKSGMASTYSEFGETSASGNTPQQASMSNSNLLYTTAADYDLLASSTLGVSPNPSMTTALSGMGITPEQYLPDDQLAVSPEDISLQHASMMDMGINGDWEYLQNSNSRNNGQYANQATGSYLELPDQFPHRGSDVIGDNRYRPGWAGQDRTL